MVDIRTVTYHTPTSSHKGREHLRGAGGGEAGRGGQSPCGENATGGAAATPRLSGGGGGGEGGDNITLKLWDLGGTFGLGGSCSTHAFYLVVSSDFRQPNRLVRGGCFTNLTKTKQFAFFIPSTPRLAACLSF